MTSYNQLTLEKIKASIADFFKDNPDRERFDNDGLVDKNITLGELKAKILDGYMYTINKRVSTGRGGVIMFIDNAAQSGILTPGDIQSAIVVSIGKFAVPLSVLTVKKKVNEQEETV